MDTPPLDDEQLLAELRAALSSVDGVPESVTEAARAAYSWRTIDAELAALSYDSFLDDKELAGVRSGGEGPRMLTFDADDVTLEIEVDRGRIIGQLVPPQAGEVEIRQPGGSITVQADQLGRFSADGIGRGPVSLRCVTPGATPIITEWIVV